jgi:hypothetical protein
MLFKQNVANGDSKNKAMNKICTSFIKHAIENSFPQC